jgi:hypothetical protein
MNDDLADDARGRKLSRAEVARLRGTAKRLDLGRHLEKARVRRWAGMFWTAEQDALLGTVPDADLAEQFGRTENAVRVRRIRLGVATFQDRRCSVMAGRPVSNSR